MNNDESQFLSSKIQSGAYVDNIHVDGNRAATPTTGAHEYIIKDIQFKRGSDSSLASYVPKAGEPVFEQNGTTYRLKIGNGTTAYSSLPYIGADFVPDVDNRSVNVVGTNLQIYGFNTVTGGSIPRKTVSGTLEWIKLGDVIEILSGVATLVTKTAVPNGDLKFTVDVLTDNNTVKVNTSNNKLYVPIDNDTVKSTINGLTAKKTVAGDGIKVTTDTNNQYVITADYKAGDNINIEKRADGMYINSTGGGGSTVNIQAGDGIKVTQSGANTIISGDYQAGDYININKVAGKMEISVDPAAVSNTYRPIQLNGVEIAPMDPSSGPINFESTEDLPQGIRMQGITGVGSRSIRMELSNMGLLHAQEVGTPHRSLANLTGRLIAFHCGNADFSNTLNH